MFMAVVQGGSHTPEIQVAALGDAHTDNSDRNDGYTSDKDTDVGQTEVGHTDLVEPDVSVSSSGSSSRSSSGSSSRSSNSCMQLRFQLHADAMRFAQFVQLSIVFASMYTITATTAFFSSLYPVAQGKADRHSTVDAFLLTSSFIAIGIASAFLVVTGFFCAYTSTNVNSSDVCVLFRMIVLHTVIDV
jgi:hypothetical protein